MYYVCQIWWDDHPDMPVPEAQPLRMKKRKGEKFLSSNMDAWDLLKVPVMLI
jgi:hypothetical protein